VVGPHSEADPVAILAQALTAFGNCIGRSAHFLVEANRHYPNIDMVLVGTTSKSRKGTAWSQVRRLFKAVDQDWESQRIQSGLSSGEGLIWAVRDEIRRQEPIREKGRVVDYQQVVVDPAVEDKRLLVVEAEFASTLKVMTREGNTLSPVIRQAWEAGKLSTLTKNSPATATGAHISIIGHITRQELLRHLNSTEMANGFANRFLWGCVRRSKYLPDGGALGQDELAPLVVRFTEAVRYARTVGNVGRDEAAQGAWRTVYPELSGGRSGLLGAVTSRAEAQVTRLALLYALMDCSPVIGIEHLKAALALWEYFEASARYIFGASLGDPMADALLRLLRNCPAGLTRTDIRDMFQRNKKAADVDRGLGVLLEEGFVRYEDEVTGGRPARRWYAEGAS